MRSSAVLIFMVHHGSGLEIRRVGLVLVVKTWTPPFDWFPKLFRITLLAMPLQQFRSCCNIRCVSRPGAVYWYPWLHKVTSSLTQLDAQTALRNTARPTKFHRTLLHGLPRIARVLTNIDKPLLRKPADRLGKIVLANEVSIRGSGGWTSREGPEARN